MASKSSWPGGPAASPLGPGGNKPPSLIDLDNLSTPAPTASSKAQVSVPAPATVRPSRAPPAVPPQTKRQQGGIAQTAEAHVKAQAQALAQVQNQVQTQVQPRAQAVKDALADQAVDLDTVCVEVRLPPLHPKHSARLRGLASAWGCLYGWPGRGGTALLQWCNTEHSLTLPQGTARCPEEDADSAPALAVPLPAAVSAPVTAALCSEATGAMFTGHDNGVITRWSLSADGGPPTPLHSWSAHRTGKIGALALTQWGELWSGSTAGNVKVWGYPGAATGSRPPVQVREPRRGRGVKLAHSKVRCLVVAPGGRWVWSCGSDTVSVWDAYSGEHVGQLRRCGDPPGAGAAGLGEDADEDDIDAVEGIPALRQTLPFEARTVLSTGSDCDSDGELSAVPRGGSMAAGTVAAASATALAAAKGLRVVNKWRKKVINAAVNAAASQLEGAKIADEWAPPRQRHVGSRKLRVLVAGPDGSMWLGTKRGLLERYTQHGQLLWQASGFEPGIMTLLVTGPTVWTGLSDGRIVEVSDTGSPLRAWPAHRGGVRALAPMAHLVASLGQEGAVRAWPAQRVAPAKARQWADGVRRTLTRRQLRVLAGTWNVNEQRPSREALEQWVGGRARAGADVVMLGLQEVEVGASVGRDVFNSYLNPSALEKGSAAAQWWAVTLLSVLGESSWRRVALRQMSGIIVLVYVRAELAPAAGEVATACVACGVMGVGGNKGGAAVSFSLFRRRIAAVAAHLAAHQEMVEARNADYAKIVRHMAFNIPGILAAGADVAASEGSFTGTAGAASADDEALAAAEEEETGPGASGLAGQELLVWMGDFNYRVDATFEGAVDAVRAAHLPDLLALDQAVAECARGTVFGGLVEGPINFPPTYKCAKHVAWDSSDPPYDAGSDPAKPRIPSWTDRIFFRGSVRQSSALEMSPLAGQDDVVVRLAAPTCYSAVLEVGDSDHKPVWAQLLVELPHWRQEVRRAVSLRCLQASAEERTAVDKDMALVECTPSSVFLRSGSSATFTLRNRSPRGLYYSAVASPAATGGLSAPLAALWLQLGPTHGALPPGGAVPLVLRGAFPPNHYSARALAQYNVHVSLSTELPGGVNARMTTCPPLELSVTMQT